MFAPPLTFEDGWSHAMRHLRMRQWLFNRAAPTSQELCLLREQRPFILQCTVTKNIKLYGQCHRLPDGVVLGLVMTFDARNGDVPLVAGHDAAYGDNRYVVTRFAAYAVDYRIVSMEFAWMASGVLSVRYHPYPNLSAINLLNYRIFAFAAIDANFMWVMSNELHPPLDFMLGRFESMLFLNPWYTMLFVDTSFQGPCGFCTMRGDLQCGCPTPMKRRRFEQSNRGMAGTVARPAHAVYDEIVAYIATTKNDSTILYNIIVSTPTTRDVPYSGIIPFSFALIQTVTSHELMQQFMSFAGSTAGDPWRLQVASAEGGVDDSPVTTDGSDGRQSLSGDGRASHQSSWNSAEVREGVAPASPVVTSFDLPTFDTLPASVPIPRAPDDQGFLEPFDASTASASLDQRTASISNTRSPPSPIQNGTQAASTSDVGAQPALEALDLSTASLSLDEPASIALHTPLPPPPPPDAVTCALSAFDASVQQEEQDISVVQESRLSEVAVPSSTMSTDATSRRISSVSNSSGTSGNDSETRKVELSVGDLRRLAYQAAEDAVRSIGKQGAPVAKGGAGARPSRALVFSCDICDKRILGKRSNLKRHIAITHNKERNFACTVAGCERKFPSKHNLERHQKSMHANLFAGSSSAEAS